MNVRIKKDLCLYLLPMILIGSCTSSDFINYEKLGATSPANAVETYHVVDGFNLELFASEPVIQNPTDMTIDEYGRVFVVEMIGYPLELNHTGKVKLLRDTDGDGIMDSATIFADDLVLPNGVMPWRDGILVTDAPYLLYFKDTTGNGIADIRDTILTGFALSNPHVNVNDPIYGLDNWIYLANFGPLQPSIYKDEFGDMGHKITFWDDTAGLFLPKAANSKNVRVNLKNKTLEMLSSRSQFGFSFDEWGDLFNTNNQNHIYQEAIAAEYVSRNPDLLLTDASDIISDHGKQAVVFQSRVDSLGRINVTSQTTTSSSGITYYSGGLFPPPYDKDVTFVTESAFGLVHADKLSNNGAVFRASRIPEKKEFLASSDKWARPANIYIGPDGALYVLDFYQKIIEHPEWLSEDVRKHGDLYAGQKMGRIYRVTPKGTENASSWIGNISIGKERGEDLIKYFNSSNSWWRYTAQRLLVTRDDKQVVPSLVQNISTDTSALGRLHSLWTLDGLNSLSMKTLFKALHDSNPGIRRNAIKISEKFLGNGSDILRRELYSMENDPNLKVQYQLLNTLGFIEDSKALEIRKQILLRNIEDKWFRIAALTAEGLRPYRLLRDLIPVTDVNEQAKLSMVRQLTSLIAGRSDTGDDMISHLVSMSSRDKGLRDSKLVGAAILTGLIKGLESNENRDVIIRKQEKKLINNFFDHVTDSIGIYSLTLLKLGSEKGTNDSEFNKNVEEVLSVVKDKQKSTIERIQMLNYLSLIDPSPYSNDLEKIILDTRDAEIQKATIDVLSHVKGREPANFLLSNWVRVRNSSRNTALNLFLDSDDRKKILIQALRDSVILVSDLGVETKALLARSGDSKIREEAQALFKASGNDKEVPERFKKAFKGITGRDVREIADLSKGSSIFEQNCSVCHQIQGELGHDYGPDLSTVRGWTNIDLTFNIIHPDASIAQGFNLYSIKLKSGKTLNGILKGESTHAISLQLGPDTHKTINRSDIERMDIIEDASAMTPGFGEVLSPEDMVNLIAFIRQSLD